MTYHQTINYLFNALPMFQNQGKSAYKENLDNTNALMVVLDNPHKKFKSIHIAGTNGKGSVSHMLAAIFQKCGYKTGLYTSPHLLDFRERIRINGEMISEQSVIDFTEQNMASFEEIKPSFFEMTVALAFNVFAQEKVDIAIVETGMGGRLDSTNVIIPEASIITNISTDHVQFLGNTLEKIATEKAGIIKPNTPTILGDMDSNLIPVFKKVTEEKNSKLYLSSEIYKRISSCETDIQRTITYNNNGNQIEAKTDLKGIYQEANVATVLACTQAICDKGNFILPNNLVLDALKNVKATTGLRGRWDILQQEPLWIADTGHNEAGIKFIMQQISNLKQEKITIIYGCVGDKEYSKILDLLNPQYNYIFTQSTNKRSLDSQILFDEATKRNFNCSLTHSVKEAISLGREQNNTEVATIICGSTFVVADALSEF